MTITRINILLQNGCTDLLYIYTDLPSPFPYDPTQPCSLKLECTQGTGEEYVKKNFPNILYKITDARN
jgi:hypothetical protein